MIHISVCSGRKEAGDRRGTGSIREHGNGRDHYGK